MANVSQVREALADRLSTIEGLRVLQTPTDAIYPPSVVIGDVSIQFDESFGRGLDVLTFTLRVYAAKTDDGRRAVNAVDAFITGFGEQSIKAAVEADRRLGDVVADARVTSVQNYGAYEVAGQLYVGADLTVTIYCQGA